MRIELILQHGWGFDSRVWNGWLGQLNDLCETTIFHVGERGYYGAEPFYPAFIDKQSFKVIICHSIGMHLLNPELLQQADAICLVSSFLQFHPLDQLSHRRSKRVVRAMKEKLQTTPYIVLRDFLKLCYSTDDGLPMLPLATIPAEEHLDRQRLLDDLELLDESNLLDAFSEVRDNAMFCLFHGTDDQVVSPDKSVELAGMLSQSQIFLVENGGHALPTTHTAYCVETLKESLLTKLETRYVNLSP